MIKTFCILFVILGKAQVIIDTCSLPASCLMDYFVLNFPGNASLAASHLAKSFKFWIEFIRAEEQETFKVVFAHIPALQICLHIKTSIEL